MFWRRCVDQRFEYLSVTKIEEVVQDSLLDGQKEFRFHLSDGSSETLRLDREMWGLCFAELIKMVWWSTYNPCRHVPH
ncbi:MAG: hypothetical protein ACYDHY_18300 [Acidiferrobacterales bacterium]